MTEAYERDHILTAYFKWHYGQGLRESFLVLRNFLWFISHFFSFKLLSKTLFAPWKRMGEKYSGGFNFENFASALIVNLIMRAVGFVTRVIILSLGFLSYIFSVLLGFVTFMVWVFAPVVLIACIVLSITFFMI